MSSEEFGQEIKETMEDFKEELEKSFRKLQVGDIIKGTILAIAEEEITVDLKYYTQGILAVSEISEDPFFLVSEHYKVGGEIQATILSMDDGQGNIKLSIKGANHILAWDVLNEYKEKETPLTVKVSGTVSAGVVAYVEGIRAFIPASQLSLQYVENTEEWLNKTLEVAVINVEPEKEKVILSAKVLLQKKQGEELNQKISRLVPGSVFDGVVESVMPYGAFINVGEGLTGLVHISKISQRRIKNPSEVVKTGDKVKVKLIDIKDGKLSLSMKEFEDMMDMDADSTETFEYKETGEATTSLGNLFKNLKI